MNHAVAIEDLCFCYPDGQPALEGINLVIPQGQSVAIIGPTGAGKSTLLLHLNGILCGEGIVKILGTVIDDHSLKWVRSQVGLVFQNPDDQLFMPTVFDDVAFGPLNMGCPEEEVRQRTAVALQRVGMSDLEQRSPHHLSLGQKKRISVATVLSMTTQILVLDEPTSNLHPESKWGLIELLRSLSKTRIIATHDLEVVAALCERTIIMNKGAIVADGDTSSILTDTPLLRGHGLARPAKPEALFDNIHSSIHQRNVAHSH